MKKASRSLVRACCVVVTLCMLVTLCACGDTAETSSTVPQANPASDFVYEVNGTGDGIIITKYVGTSKQVVIPDKIDGLPVVTLTYKKDQATKQYVGAFMGSDIQTVRIPDTVVTIAPYVFSDCTSLTQVTFGEHSALKTMRQAFDGCTALKQIDFSATELQVIGSRSFYGCTALEEVIFSDCLLEIDNEAFYGCSALTEVNLPDSLLVIESKAFGYCTSVEYLYVPANLDVFREGVIGFHGMAKHGKIEFAEGREKINGTWFFSLTADVEVIIPASVKYFSMMTFWTGDMEKKNVTFRFYGDCPEIRPHNEYFDSYFGNPTILYDPDTEGWEDCAWNGIYTVKPME